MCVCSNLLETPWSSGCGLVMRVKTFKLLIRHQNQGANELPLHPGGQITVNYILPSVSVRVNSILIYSFLRN